MAENEEEFEETKGKWPLILLLVAIGAAIALYVVIGGQEDRAAPGKDIIEQRKEMDEGTRPERQEGRLLEKMPDVTFA